MALNPIEIILRIAIIYILIAFGNILRSLSKDPDNSPYIKLLTKIILTIFFPFIVITSIINASFNSFFIVLFSVSFCIVIIFSGFLGVFLYSRVRSIPRPTLGSMFLAVSFPNSVFLPFPLILMLIGPQGLISATLFAVTVIIIQNTFGSFVALSYGDHSKSHATLDTNALIKKVVLFPPTLSMIIGFLLKFIFQPVSVSAFLSFLPIKSFEISSSIDFINWISLILALILVGLTFNLQFSSFSNRFILETSFFRLLVPPTFGIVFIVLMDLLFPSSGVFQAFIILPLLIQSFSGPAIINIAFSQEFSLDLDAESMYITIITLLSLLFLPILVLVSFSLL